MSPPPFGAWPCRKLRVDKLYYKTIFHSFISSGICFDVYFFHQSDRRVIIQKTHYLKPKACPIVISLRILMPYHLIDDRF